MAALSRDRERAPGHVAPPDPAADDRHDRLHAPRRRRGALRRSSTPRRSRQEIETMIESMQTRARHADAALGQEVLPLRHRGIRVPAGLRDGAVRVGLGRCPVDELHRHPADPRARRRRWSSDANADEITFFTVDATGLTTEGVGAPPATIRSRAGRASASRPGRTARTACSSWPYETGGRALLNTQRLPERPRARLPGRCRPTTRSASTSRRLTVGKYEKVARRGHAPGRDRPRAHAASQRGPRRPSCRRSAPGRRWRPT